MLTLLTGLWFFVIIMSEFCSVFNKSELITSNKINRNSNEFVIGISAEAVIIDLIFT